MKAMPILRAGVLIVIVLIGFALFNLLRTPSIYAVQDTNARSLCEQSAIGSAILSSPGIPAGEVFTFRGKAEAGKLSMYSVEYKGKVFCTTAKFSPEDRSDLIPDEKYRVVSQQHSSEGWIVIIRPEVS